ncbi:MAG: glycosyltransferase family 4 protein [Opitutaceae bacterium]|nr:glycosyltransferase family 4 protein [Cytophagales bacterium]
MRIAIVINTSWNIFNYRKGIIKALLNEGHEVIAIAPEDEYSIELQTLGCKFINLPMDNKGVNPYNDTILFFRFLRLYKNIRPQYVLHYTIKPNIYGSLACGLLSIKCISNVSGLGTVFIRQDWIFKIVQLLYKFAFTIPQRVFFQNIDDQNLFVELNILKPSKTGLIPGSGINTNEYLPEIYIKHKPFKFLLIARLLKDKGIYEYAKASQILKEKGLDIECSLVGFYDRESEYNILKADLTYWIQNDYINFIGESKNITKNINQIDCVVLPSYREGTPRSLLEAMALGKPIIATSVPGCKEVLIDGENGFFCEPKSAESLANAMIKMIGLSEDSLKEMGLKGRNIAVNKFDENIVIQSYLKEITVNNVLDSSNSIIS